MLLFITFTDYGVGFCATLAKPFAKEARRRVGLTHRRKYTRLLVRMFFDLIFAL